MRVYAAALALASVLPPSLALAQEPKPAFPQPRFEVVSIRPASGQPTVLPNGMRVLGAMRGGPGSDDPGRIVANSVPAMALLTRAYRIKNYQITGGPDWITTERYDFVATLPPAATVEQSDLMFRQMLEDRFGLKLHPGTKQFDAYNLVVAKGGLKLKDSIPTETCSMGARPVGGNCPTATYPTGIAVSPPGQRQLALGGPRDGARFLGGSATQIATLANMIQGSLGGPLVVDKTGLTGNYDYRLEFANLDAKPGDDTPYPTIFSALEKDLGLKLEPTKVTLDTLVIDHIEHPSAN